MQTWAGSPWQVVLMATSAKPDFGWNCLTESEYAPIPAFEASQVPTIAVRS